ncbi:TPA_asm: UL4.5 iORF [Human alphaherpesvirus 1]|nr:TPA_asm: UL4.5 iORF [Human alphaherpesvirus 1]
MATYALLRRRLPGVKQMATLSRLRPWERVMVMASLELMP